VLKLAAYSFDCDQRSGVFCRGYACCKQTRASKHLDKLWCSIQNIFTNVLCYIFTYVTYCISLEWDYGLETLLWEIWEQSIALCHQIY